MARKVNIRFLIILTSALALLIMAAVATPLVFKLRRGSPETYLVKGDELMAAKEYEKAMANFRQATALRPNDPEIWNRCGDALSRLAALDPENMGRAMNCWRKALEIDPNNKVALQRMLRVCQDQLDRTSQRDLPKLMTDTQEFARKLVLADPKDLTVAGVEPALIIRGWTSGIATDSQAVDDAVAKLKEFTAKNPSDADVPFWAAVAMMKRAQESVRDQRLDDARKTIAEVETMMLSAAQAQPDNAMMQLRTGLVLFETRRFAGIKGASTTLPAGITPDVAPPVDTATSQPNNPVYQHVKLAQKHVDRAAELAKPDHPSYVDIQLRAGAFAMQIFDRATAEKRYREVLSHFPDAQDARLQLAGLLALDPSKRAEAIAILDKPVDPESMSGSMGLMAQPLKLQTILALANLRLDMYVSTSDQADRTKLMTAVEDGISKVAAMAPGGQDNPLTLKLRGKQQRAVGKNIESIQTLNRALTALEQQDATDDEVLELLARSSADSGETGQAKLLLQRIIARAPTNLGARMLLAQLQLKDGDVADARPNVEMLAKLLPDNQDVMKLKLATLNLKTEADEAQAIYAKLPEKTRPERVQKAGMAAGMGNRAEAIRLFELLRTENPADVDVSIALARLYFAEDKPRAIVLIDDALKLNPANPALQMFQKQLADASPEELQKLQRELAEKTTDPLQREIALYRLSVGEQKVEEARKHLKEAERIKPDDRGVLDELFQFHIGRQEFDDAAKYVEKLAKINGDVAGGLLYRFRLAVARNDVAAALSYARDLSVKMPEFAQSWLALAQAEQASGQLDDALQHYQQALQRQNENADALRGLIECSLALNRPADAKKYIDQAVRSLPNNALFREMETNYELNYGDVTKALAAREQALEAQPKSAQVHLAAVQTYLVAARAKASRNETAAVEKYVARSMEICKAAIAAFPDEPPFYALFTEAALQAKKQEEAEAAIKGWGEREAWKNRIEPKTLLADLYARAGRLSESEAVLRDLIAKDASNVPVQLALCDLLSRQNKIEESIQVLDSANASDARIVRRRIETEIAAGKLDEADKRLQTAIAADPKSVDLLALSGFVNLSRKKWDDAASRLAQVLAIDPRNWQAQYYLALVKLQQPRPDVDEAIRLLVAAREQNPSNVDARFTLGQAYRRRNEIENATRELEAALQLQPTNKPIRLTLVSAYADALPPRWNDVERTLRVGREFPGASKDPDLLRGEAMMWQSRRDNAKATDLIRQAIAAAPQSQQLVRDYINIMRETRDHAGIIRETDKLLAGKEDPQLWWALQARGVAKRMADDKEGALKDLEAALALAAQTNIEAAPAEVVGTISREIGVDEALTRVLERAKTDSRWMITAAYLYQGKGQLDDAVASIEKATVDFAKFDAGTQRNVLRSAGTLYLSRNAPEDPQKAYDSYLKLLDLEPNDLIVLNNMACLLADTMKPPRFAEARKYSQRAYDLMVNSGRSEPLLLDTHGWVLTLNDRVDDGIDLLRRAVALNPFTEGHYHLAEAYLRRSDPQEAEKQLELASEEIRKTEEAKGLVSDDLRRKIEDAKVRARKDIEKQQAKAAN